MPRGNFHAILLYVEETRLQSAMIVGSISVVCLLIIQHARENQLSVMREYTPIRLLITFSFVVHRRWSWKLKYGKALYVTMKRTLTKNRCFERA